MEQRIALLERGVADIRAILGRLEPAIVRIDAPLPHLATKAEIETLRADTKGEIGNLRVDTQGESSKLRADLAYVRGKIEHIPTTWMMVTIMIGGQISLLAFVFALLRYLPLGR